jgi:hypothetical protein
MYTQEGRMRGHYVYMLLCQDAGGSIYIKMGISSNPISRLRALRSGCPVSPKSFAYFETYSVRVSRRIEADLHKSFAKWNAHLEWFAFLEADKAEFNAVLNAVLAHHAVPGKPFVWNRVSVKELVRISKRNQRYAQLLFATSGKSYQDFTKDQRAC